MSKRLYGRGTITEIVKGKKYYIELSAGRDPLSGRIYDAGDHVPPNAAALGDDMRPVSPRVLWGSASDEQRASHAKWRAPVTYQKHREVFEGTRRQAELRVEQIRAELGRGRALDGGKVTLSEWIEQYLTNREKIGKQRPNTLKSDRSLSKHLVRGLGPEFLADITPAMITGLYASMRSDGVGDTTVKQCHRLLKAIMRQAVDNGLISANPADKASAPKRPVPRRQSLSPEDAARLAALCEAGEPTANKTAVYIALATGARPGEIMGLTWAGVELVADRPFIRFALQHMGGGRLAPLKTDRDDNPIGRVVPIDSRTVSILSAWRVAQREALRRLGIDQNGDTPVITSGRGGFTDYSGFAKWWRSFCVDGGFGNWRTPEGLRVVNLTIGDDPAQFAGCVIEWRDSDGWPCDENGRRYSRSYKRPELKKHYEGLNFYALRHTHFSMRVAAGMDTPTAQYLGGWSSPSMLLNVYAHPIAQNVWDSAGFMDALASNAGKR